MTRRFMTPVRSPGSIRRFVLWVLLGACALLLTSGCAGSRAVGPVPQLFVGAPGGVTHQVQPQETLWSIGRQYGVSYREIMRANGLTDPRQLSTGQVLTIPQPLPSALSKVPVPLYPNPRWTHIVIHHSATTFGSARQIDRWHRRKGFTKGLGYHFVIDNGTSGRGDGQIEASRRWLRQQEGAHCNAAGMNDHGIGICLVGNFTSRPPSAAQLEALIALVEYLRAYYHIPKDHVLRHRDVPGKATECPGDRFPWAEVRAHLK